MVRKRLDESLNIAPPIRDVEAFTKKWLEPFICLLIAAFVLSGALSLWLFVSSFALLIHSHMGYAVTRDQELDVSDSIIDAAFQKDDIEAQKYMCRQMREALKKVEQRIEQEPEYVEELKENNPSILDALADLDLNLQNLGQEREEAS